MLNTYSPTSRRSCSTLARNVTRTSDSIQDNRVSLDAFLLSLTTVAKHTTTFVQRNQANLTTALDVLQPGLRTAARYAPEFPCLFRGLVNAIPLAESAVGGKQPGLGVLAQFLPPRGDVQVPEGPPLDRRRHAAPAATACRRSRWATSCRTRCSTSAPTRTELQPDARASPCRARCSCCSARSAERRSERDGRGPGARGWPWRGVSARRSCSCSASSAASALVSTYLAIVLGNVSFTDTSDYHAVFADVSGLSSDSPVRIAGVDVGQVDSVAIYKRRRGTSRIQPRQLDPADLGHPGHRALQEPHRRPVPRAVRRQQRARHDAATGRHHPGQPHLARARPRHAAQRVQTAVRRPGPQTDQRGVDRDRPGLPGRVGHHRHSAGHRVVADRARWPTATS